MGVSVKPQQKHLCIRSSCWWWLKVMLWGGCMPHIMEALPWLLPWCHQKKKKITPPKMPLCIPQLHRASFALGSIPDIIEILLCCLGKIRLRLCTAHDYAISCHSWHKCACFPRLYFFRDELALSCMQQIGAVGVSDLPEHLLTGSLAQRESSAPKFRKRLFIM